MRGEKTKTSFLVCQFHSSPVFAFTVAVTEQKSLPACKTFFFSHNIKCSIIALGPLNYHQLAICIIDLYASVLTGKRRPK